MYIQNTFYAQYMCIRSVCVCVDVFWIVLSYTIISYICWRVSPHFDHNGNVHEIHEIHGQKWQCNAKHAMHKSFGSLPRWPRWYQRLNRSRRRYRWMGRNLPRKLNEPKSHANGLLIVSDHQILAIQSAGMRNILNNIARAPISRKVATRPKPHPKLHFSERQRHSPISKATWRGHHPNAHCSETRIPSHGPTQHDLDIITEALDWHDTWHGAKVPNRAWINGTHYQYPSSQSQPDWSYIAISVVLRSCSVQPWVSCPQFGQWSLWFSSWAPIGS